jgi:putative nucleotidyltransferase with HDIG domain
VSEAVVTTGRRLGGVAPTGRLFSPLPARAWAVWAATVAAGSVVVVASLLGLAQTRSHWQAFAFLTLAASAAQLGSMQLTRNRVFHPAILFVVAGVLLLTPQQVVLMCVVQHIGDWLKQRYTWYIQPFNIANYVLAATAATFVLDHLRDHELAIVGCVATIAFVLVNRALLLCMLRFARGLSAAESGLLRFEDISLELVLGMMGVSFAILAADGVAFASLALAPLLLIYLAQNSAHELERASVTIQAQNDQLAEKTQIVIERSTATLEALSATVDARDAYTAGHSRRVREIAIRLGEELSLDQEELEALAQAALLHDIGKIGVPDAVLLKDGPLDQTEWLLMRAHAEEGARIIERLGYLADVVPAIRHHHERVDGRGYPGGLHGNEIPLPARIIHVADALDAMLTRRVYRGALTLEQAAAEIRRGSGTDFCSECVGAFDASLESGRLGAVLPLEGGAQ